MATVTQRQVLLLSEADNQGDDVSDPKRKRAKDGYISSQKAMKARAINMN